MLMSAEGCEEIQKSRVVQRYPSPVLCSEIIRSLRRIIPTGIVECPLHQAAAMEPAKTRRFAEWMESLKWYDIGLAMGCYLLLHFWSQRRNCKAGLPLRWPLLGILPSLLLNTERLHEWTTDILRACGGTYVFVGPWLSGMQGILTCDPRNIEYALKINFPNYPKGPEFRAVFQDLLGHGIFNADGKSWKLQRRVASLQFTSGSFRQFAAKTVREMVHNKLVPLLADAAVRNIRIDLQDAFLRYTFDNTCALVFGRNPGCLSIGFPRVAFAEAFDDGVEATLYRHLVPGICWRISRLLNLGKERQFRRALKPLQEFVDDLLAHKTQTVPADGDQNLATDLLSCLMRQKLPPINGNDSREFLRDTVMNFVIAGRDTSGVALSWFFWLLSQNPPVEEKIVDELSAVLRRRNLQEIEEPFTAEELQECVYLHAALSETLRLYPSVPIDHKGVVKDDVFPDGTPIKSGMRFLYSIYSLGRMQSVWGADCLEFKPERWIDPGSQGRLRKESGFKFLAFNGGPRICLGKDLAYLQMKAAAAGILRRFRVQVMEGHVVLPKVSLILSMKKGLIVTLRERPPIVLVGEAINNNQRKSTSKGLA